MKESTKHRLFEVTLLAFVLWAVCSFCWVIYIAAHDVATSKDRLREEGRMAARNGVSDAGNPYQHYSDRKLWLEGWVEGKRSASAVGGVR